MPIADALAQIQFCEKKAASYVEMVWQHMYCDMESSIQYILQVLLDTQRKAVQKYEADPRNLWVGKFALGVQWNLQ